MRRITTLLLDVALLLAALGALGMLVRVVLALFLPVTWYWGGAVALFAAPALFAGALTLVTRLAPATDKTHA